METRLERNKRRKKKNTRRKLKFIAIACVFLCLLFAIGVVNQRIVDLKCMENPTIIKINIDSRIVELFGKQYEFDFNRLKKLLEDRFSGLFVLHKPFYLL